MAMSEEHEAELNEEPEAPPVRVVRDDADWFLQALVWMAKSGVEYGVTLDVGGFLASGLLIDGEKYFDERKAEFVSAVEQQWGE